MPPLSPITGDSRPAPATGLSRRAVLAAGGAGLVALAGWGEARAARQPTGSPATEPKPSPTKAENAGPLFRISLAQWSLHRMLYAGKLDHLDFPAFAKERFGIVAVEYVNAFFAKKGNAAYVDELKKRCADAGVTSVLIMCDGEGALGDPDAAARTKTVENHLKWLDAAKALGCHAIRVNAQSTGTYEEQQKLAADGLRRLCERADPLGLSVIVENHGGLSSDAKWLAGVMKQTDHPRAGTLPDFGNFPKEADRVTSVAALMPFARAVSAKSWDFDDKSGDHVGFDYAPLMKTVVAAGYRGWVGVEYEGSRLGEPEGVLATKRLLERLRDELRKPT